MVSVKVAENNEDIKEIAELAEVIWHEYFSSLLSPEQIDYMVEKFQSYKAIKEAVDNDGYKYYKEGDPVDLYIDPRDIMQF